MFDFCMNENDLAVAMRAVDEAGKRFGRMVQREPQQAALAALICTLAATYLGDLLHDLQAGSDEDDALLNCLRRQRPLSDEAVRALEVAQRLDNRLNNLSDAPHD